MCETSDFLGKDRDLVLQEGDLLAVRSSGAYGLPCRRITIPVREWLKSWLMAIKPIWCVSVKSLAACG
ncbi:hypothetical protein, partial [Klebsiella pneumoniae]|uniref:hypothetical protein n=1 Tax=Klebsiella pneumoniae TaxID=573 RepID=UPI0029F4F851